VLAQTQVADNSQHQINVVRKHTQQIAMQPANVNPTPVTGKFH
jgi:hypothetical protein